MNEPLPIDASDWNADEVDSGIVAPGAAKGLSGLADFARDRLIAMVEDARGSLVGQIRGLKSLADLLINTLGDNAQPVSRVVAEASGTIDSIADALAEKSVEELVEDGRALVKAQPVAAVGLAIAIGFLAGRMLKSARD